MKYIKYILKIYENIYVYKNMCAHKFKYRYLIAVDQYYSE